jgi:hypothetical protein
MSGAATLPASPGMVGVVEAAARHDLIVLAKNDGSTITLVDLPVLAWQVGAPGTAPVPVIVDELTEPWAHCTITPHPASSPELIGGLPEIAVFVPDVWRGSFSQFLTWIETSTGLPVVGTQLGSDALKGAFGAWISDKYGGRVFFAVAP